MFTKVIVSVRAAAAYETFRFAKNVTYVDLVRRKSVRPENIAYSAKATTAELFCKLRGARIRFFGTRGIKSVLSEFFHEFV